MSRKSELVSVSRIVVPSWCERPLSKVMDDRDRSSIEKEGIQQPLVVLRDGARIILVKGLRRFRIARAIGLQKVPVIVTELRNGESVDSYGRELRLSLDVHRQDLVPSQKAWIVEELKRRFGMTNKQIAAHLHVDADSITNWTSIRNYIPEVVAALDGERMTMAAARVFDGMTEKGQGTVWRRHADELSGSGKAGIHRRIRQLYPPADHPDYYRQPKLVTQRLERKSGRRRGKTTVTRAEKSRLMSSVELKEIELKEGIADEKRMKAEIAAATVPIYGIMRSEKLRAMLPADVAQEFERFMEVY